MSDTQYPAARLEFSCSRRDSIRKGMVSIWPDDIFKIGRDPQANDFCISSDKDSLVSRNHCEIYTVVYEPNVNHIYVRDRSSFNGTYVNNTLIGKGPELTPGFLLRDGDKIAILPYWRFTLRQEHGATHVDMTATQVAESRLFSNQYSISNRCIGQGSDAKVFLAHDVVTKRQIVCKVMDLGQQAGRLGSDGHCRKLQEADILRQIRHPNILPYIDAIVSPHSLFIFTEIASGGDLMSFINRHDGVKEFDTRIIMRQITRGLSFLHSKGIIHRDLKPENILLAYSPRMAYHRIMLNDFAHCAVPKRSRKNTAVGTATYKAPEVSGSQERQTPAVDIWSIGIIAAVMLTASLNIEDTIAGLSRCDEGTIRQSLKHEVFQPSLRLSKNSKTFVWQCLRLSPTDRLTAPEAERHDWFCTPEEHLAFFEKLDRRIMESWQAPTELSPLPLRLPSVVFSPWMKPQIQAEGQRTMTRRYPLLGDDMSSYSHSHVGKTQASPGTIFDSQSSAPAGSLHDLRSPLG